MKRWTWRVAIFVAVCGSSDLLAGTPWETYLEQPSAERATQVQAISYSEAADDPAREERDLMLLEVQVLSRDVEAVRLAFRLYAGADGHRAEVLETMLGRLVRIDAKLLLKELNAVGAKGARPRCPVGNLGPAYVDRTQARAYEVQQRQAALRDVSDPKLYRVRDQCLVFLKE